MRQRLWRGIGVLAGVAALVVTLHAAASYPTAIKSFTTKASGDTVQAAHINDLQDEVTAIETNLLQAPTTYTPTWGNTGTANSLGNGTLTGAYWQVGKFVRFRLSLTWGTTTTSGSGNWTLSLPTTAETFAMAGGLTGIAQDSSATAFYPITALSASTTTFSPVYHFNNGSNIVGLSNLTTSTPFTWASGDTLTITGWYFGS